MTKIDIFSGFLGAGKTTLIKKLIKEAFAGEKLVLIENEFGDIGIDGGFMQEAGIEVTEMNSGCICCSLVGDFGEALKKVLKDFCPDRILIEPSGVGKLSDVIKAVKNIESDAVKLNSFTTVVDAKKCKMYMKNFGEFFNNQIEHAATVVLSHTSGISEDKLSACIDLIREHNDKAVLVTTDWEALSGAQILAAMEREDTLETDINNLKEDTCPVCGHHHDHHHDEDCCCGHHDHHHDEDCCHHEHHHHEEECSCEHEHHHEHQHCDHHEHSHTHDEYCGHHHHEHHHSDDCHCGHHHHHADEVFNSWGIETAKVFTIEEISEALSQLSNTEKYGTVLRAKGIVAGKESWIHFDYVPDEIDVRNGSASVIGRLCVIGSQLNENNIAELFRVEVK